MPLPQIEIPTYELELASSGKKIKYRPFLVKEKKILMMAYEAKSTDDAYLAVKQIVNNCTFGQLSVEDMPLFDLQYVFLKIRSKSVGEISKFKFPCPNCKASISSMINFENVKLQKSEENDPKIMINERIGIMMKYPSIKIEKIIETSDVTNVDEKIILNCIDYIFDGDSLYHAADCSNEELLDLLNNLTEEQYKKIQKFFKTLPKLQHPISYECKQCKNTGTFMVDDLNTFFD